MKDVDLHEDLNVDLDVDLDLHLLCIYPPGRASPLE